MSKFKTFIVEDRAGPLKRLLKFLAAYPNVIDLDTLQIAQSFREAQNIILNGNKFDLSILDKMLDAGKTCFDLITKENKDSFGIIALNSQDKNSQRYFEEISPLGGYLVLRKPYNETDIADLIEQLLKVNRTPEVILGNDKSLLLKERSREFPVAQDKIAYIEVDDNYCHIFYIDNSITKKCTMTKQLKHYEGRLNKRIFFRISDKHLLNLGYIQELSEGAIKLNIKYDGVEIFLPLPDKNKPAFNLLYTK